MALSKVCRECGHTKTMDAFPFARRSGNAERSNVCKACSHQHRDRHKRSRRNHGSKAHSVRLSAASLDD